MPPYRHRISRAFPLLVLSALLPVLISHASPVGDPADERA